MENWGLKNEKTEIKNNFTITKQARREECFAAAVLENLIFMGQQIIIGDNIKIGRADLLINSNLGIEVFQLEINEDYLFVDYIKQCEKLNYDYDQCKNIKNTKPNFKVGVDDGKISYIQSSNKTRDTQDTSFYYEPEFRENIEQKLSKLNSNNYGNQETDLCIISIKRYKNKCDVTNIETYYDDIKKNYGKFFKKVYIILSTGLYILEDGKKFITYQFTNNTYNEFIKKSNELFNLIKKS